MNGMDKVLTLSAGKASARRCCTSAVSRARGPATPPRGTSGGAAGEADPIARTAIGSRELGVVVGIRFLLDEDSRATSFTVDDGRGQQKGEGRYGHLFPSRPTTAAQRVLEATPQSANPESGYQGGLFRLSTYSVDKRGHWTTRVSR